MAVLESLTVDPAQNLSIKILEFWILQQGSQQLSEPQLITPSLPSPLVEWMCCCSLHPTAMAGQPQFKNVWNRVCTWRFRLFVFSLCFSFAHLFVSKNATSCFIMELKSCKWKPEARMRTIKQCWPILRWTDDQSLQFVGPWKHSDVMLHFNTDLFSYSCYKSLTCKGE